MSVRGKKGMEEGNLEGRGVKRTVNISVKAESLQMIKER